MKPVDFTERVMVLAEEQEEYRSLPVWRSGDGIETVSCWQLTLKERLVLLWTGRLWLRQLTFKQPLQPQLPQVEKPPMTGAGV